MQPAAARAARRRNLALVRAFGPVIESLEPRRLLAAAALVDGVVTWTGGPEANKLVAEMKAKTLLVRTDGVVVETLAEPGQVVAPQRASALAGAVHSATVRAAAWLALALPAPV